MFMKHCSGCDQDRPLDDFHLQRRAADGRQAICKSCKRERDRVRYRDGDGESYRRIRRDGRLRRAGIARAFVVEHLREHACSDCSETDIVVMEFDHVRGKKLGNVSEMVSNGMHLTRVAAEIAKCEVVCANCHRRRTAKRAGFYRVVA